MIKPLNTKTRILVTAIQMRDCDDFWGTKALKGKHLRSKGGTLNCALAVWNSET